MIAYGAHLTSMPSLSVSSIRTSLSSKKNNVHALNTTTQNMYMFNTIYTKHWQLGTIWFLILVPTEISTVLNGTSIWKKKPQWNQRWFWSLAHLVHTMRRGGYPPYKKLLVSEHKAQVGTWQGSTIPRMRSKRCVPWECLLHNAHNKMP